MKNREVRAYSSGIEARTVGDDMIIEGYAVVFNSPSKPLYGGAFIEEIDKRAFDGVSLDNVFMLYNHNKDEVMGNTSSGTLDLKVNERGLHFTSKIPYTQRGKDTFELVKRGDIQGVSFGFLVKSDTWNTKVSPERRTITAVKELIEISITPYPAYEDTEVSARAIDFLNECRSCRATAGITKAATNADEAKQILKEATL